MGFTLGGTSMDAFRRYCASFYGDGPDSLMGRELPGGPFTVDEIHAAVLLVANLFADTFYGDSLDRERVRETVLFARDMRRVGVDSVGARMRGAA